MNLVTNSQNCTLSAELRNLSGPMLYVQTFNIHLSCISLALQHRNLRNYEICTAPPHMSADNNPVHNRPKLLMSLSLIHPLTGYLQQLFAAPSNHYCHVCRQLLQMVCTRKHQLTKQQALNQLCQQLLLQLPYHGQPAACGTPNPYLHLVQRVKLILTRNSSCSSSSCSILTRVADSD